MSGGSYTGSWEAEKHDEDNYNRNKDIHCVRWSRDEVFSIKILYIKWLFYHLRSYAGYRYSEPNTRKSLISTCLSYSESSYWHNSGGIWI